MCKRQGKNSDFLNGIICGLISGQCRFQTCVVFLCDEHYDEHVFAAAEFSLVY